MNLDAAAEGLIPASTAVDPQGYARLTAIELRITVGDRPPAGDRWNSKTVLISAQY